MIRNEALNLCHKLKASGRMWRDEAFHFAMSFFSVIAPCRTAVIF